MLLIGRWTTAQRIERTSWAVLSTIGSVLEPAKRNGYDPLDEKLVASYFSDGGAYHASVGLDHLGKSFRGRTEVLKGVQIFFDNFPNGCFENLKVNLFGSFGTFEWDFVVTDAHGKKTSTAGFDLLEFEGNMVKNKNAFRKARPEID